MPERMDGDSVRKARQERGLSQRELAKRAGVALTTVQSFEGEKRKVNRSSIAAILAALDAVSPMDTKPGADDAGAAPPILLKSPPGIGYTYLCGACEAFIMSAIYRQRDRWADDIRDYKRYCEHCGTRIDWKGAEEP